jgi:hypothetical protein
LIEKVAAPVKKTENKAVDIRHADYSTPPLSAKVGTNVVDKWRSLGIVRSRTKATELLRCLVGKPEGKETAGYNKT